MLRETFFLISVKTLSFLVRKEKSRNRESRKVILPGLKWNKALNDLISLSFCAPYFYMHFHISHFFSQLQSFKSQKQAIKGVLHEYCIELRKGFLEKWCWLPGLIFREISSFLFSFITIFNQLSCKIPMHFSCSVRLY